MIDGADKTRFTEVKSTLDRLYDPDNSTDLAELPLLFLINKKELPDFSSAADIDAIL